MFKPSFSHCFTGRQEAGLGELAISLDFSLTVLPYLCFNIIVKAPREEKTCLLLLFIFFFSCYSGSNPGHVQARHVLHHWATLTAMCRYSEQIIILAERTLQYAGAHLLKDTEADAELNSVPWIYLTCLLPSTSYKTVFCKRQMGSIFSLFFSFIQWIFMLPHELSGVLASSDLVFTRWPDSKSGFTLKQFGNTSLVLASCLCPLPKRLWSAGRY